LNPGPIRYLEVSVVIEVAYRLSRDKPERKYSPNPSPKQECGLARPSQPRIQLVLKARPLISSATYSQSSSRQSAGAIQALILPYVLYPRYDSSTVNNDRKLSFLAGSGSCNQASIGALSLTFGNQRRPLHYHPQSTHPSISKSHPGKGLNSKHVLEASNQPSPKEYSTKLENNGEVNVAIIYARISVDEDGFPTLWRGGMGAAGMSAPHHVSTTSSHISYHSSSSDVKLAQPLIPIRQLVPTPN
jgi:hypothetical protein